MSLVDYAWPATLDTSANDLIRDFFEPALARSIRYDRGVGYFTSGWLRAAASGMVQFAAAGGRGRWVTSPILNEDDWEAIRAGDAARRDSALRAVLAASVDDLAKSLEQFTLSALAWMVADEVLSIKLALPRNKLDLGDFHDKFGIFSDGLGNAISFNGSYNDSMQGLRNYESIKIFCGWIPSFAPLVQADSHRFENLWSNLDPNVRVFSLPEAARERIVELRSAARPYDLPHDWRQTQPSEDRGVSERVEPAVPGNVVLRQYQLDAVNAWFAHESTGILEMATGTGKTLTALSAAARLCAREKRLVVAILCPYKHLVSQWAEVAQDFGFRPVLAVEASSQWVPELRRQLQVFKHREQGVVCVIATNSAFARGLLGDVLSDSWSATLLVADEVHNAGAPRMLAALPSRAPWRLGLSATPLRHFDEMGTEGLMRYFGNVVYRFGLKEAIGKYLTPYIYRPVPVELTTDEFEEFCILTRALRKFTHGRDEPMSEVAQRLAIKRARVQNNSRSKLAWLDSNLPDHANLEHSLFYVGDRLFGEVKQLLGLSKHIRLHEFTQRQSAQERSQLLERFSSGDLQALIAMRCLDEGVDVPPTRTAYFLASSGNPREFVQRRGRVLRLWPGKNYATIVDLISIPPTEFVDMGELGPDYPAVRAAVRREYRRVCEFAELAENRYQALEPMLEIADRLHLNDTHSEEERDGSP